MLPSWLSWLTPQLIMLMVLGAVVISSLLLWVYVFVIRANLHTIHNSHDSISGVLERVDENLEYVASAVEKLADHHHIDGGPTNPVDPLPIIVQEAVPRRAIEWEDAYATEVTAPGMVQPQDLGLELFAEPEQPAPALVNHAPQVDEPRTGPMPVSVAAKAKLTEAHGLPPVPEPAPRSQAGSTRYRAAVQHITSGPVTVPDQTPRPPIIRPPMPPRGANRSGRHAHPDDA